MSPSDGSDAEEPQSTRPISVAELLARHGTLGAPPAGGRRRRRRGNSNAVTVAELTAEIPVIRDEPPPSETSDVDPVVEEVDSDAADVAELLEADVPEADEPEIEETAEADEPDADEPEVEETAELEETAEADEPEADEPEADEADVEEPEADEADVEEPEADEADVEETAEGEEPELEETTEAHEPDRPPLADDPVVRRDGGPPLSHDPRPLRRSSGAEQMAYDPVDESVDLADLVGAATGDSEVMRSYLTASGGTLFSGETVADDLARRGVGADAATADELRVGVASPNAGRPAGKLAALRAAAVAAGQSVLAVLFGAGLFIGFDQLWRWNTIVALVLSVLVILGLVVAVRVVRRTEDIASTLIAVAVGALVTLGPLALLQSYG